jgi:hypothetical protein
VGEGEGVEEGEGGYVFNIHLSLSSCTNHEKAFNCLQSGQMRSVQLLEYTVVVKKTRKNKNRKEGVRRRKVGSASACCKAGPSSILRSASHGEVFPTEPPADGPRRMVMDNCIV